MNNENLKILPYTATSLSVIGRFIFMYLLYKNKSTNSLSLIFCIISICSSSMWIYYSIINNDLPMIVRSSTELTLLSISSIYIIRNKLINNNQILPSQFFFRKKEQQKFFLEKRTAKVLFRKKNSKNIFKLFANSFCNIFFNPNFCNIFF